MDTNVSELYHEHKTMLKQKAYKYFKTQTRLQFEEIESECNFVFLTCHKNFNPAKNTSFKTYLNNCLNYSLTELRYKNNQLPTPVNEWMLEQPCYDTIQKKIEYKEWRNELSTEAQKIVRVIFRTPLENISVTKTKKITKRSVSTYLQKNGWRPQHITYYFNELKNALNF